jgi:hypothetical protein
MPKGQSMHARWVRFAPVLAFLALVAAASTASAQFGHPLKGTWSGDWGPTRDNRTHVTLDLNWDGKTITGSINPGPNAVALKTTLDPATWMVHFEGDGKDKGGAAVHYVIDGKLENLGSFQRVITGTWTQGSMKGDFKVVRN